MFITDFLVVIIFGRDGSKLGVIRKWGPAVPSLEPNLMWYTVLIWMSEKQEWGIHVFKATFTDLCCSTVMETVCDTGQVMLCSYSHPHRELRVQSTQSSTPSAAGKETPSLKKGQTAAGQDSLWDLKGWQICLHIAVLILSNVIHHYHLHWSLHHRLES